MAKVLQNLHKQVIEDVLKAELEAHLGYAKYTSSLVALATATMVKTVKPSNKHVHYWGES